MDETLRLFHRVHSFAGIPIFAKHNWDSRLWLLLQIFNFIIGGLCFIFTSGFVITNHSDFLLCIQGACIWTTGVIMTITLGICLLFRKRFRSFLIEMAFKDGMLDMPLIEHILSMPQGGKKISELKDLVITSQEKLLKYSRILMRTYVTNVFICATLYLCTPIYQMIVTKNKSLRLLAFDMWFPWSLENFKVYILSFIFHAYAGYLCCIAYPGLQSTIILLVGQVIRQIRILAFILIHVNDLALEVTGAQDEKWQTHCTLILTQCVDHYVKIKRFSNRLNVICRPFYLTLIMVAIMLVCMCSVKIAISNKLSLDTMKYYIHEFCFILVVLMFCFLGQQVENECEALENAITEKWYIYDRTHKVDVLIFNMALSQRMPIYIFGTIPLSLPTFTWPAILLGIFSHLPPLCLTSFAFVTFGMLGIPLTSSRFIKTGMSFFTLVMSVLEEENN